MELNVMQWNCRSFQAHKHELERYLQEAAVAPDIVCVEETLLKPGKNPQIDGYSIYRQDHPLSQGGGLALLLKEGINHTLMCLEAIEGIERQGIEICTDNGKLTIINIYIAPG